MSDTPAQVQQRYHEMLLTLTPSERLKMASRMYDSCRKLVISGIKSQRKRITAAQLRGQLFLRMYGNDFSPFEKERIAERIPNLQLDTDT